MNCRSLLALLLALVLLLALLAGCGQTTEESALETGEEDTQSSQSAEVDSTKYQSQVFAMDTIMILTAYGANGQEALDIAEQAIYDLETDFDPEDEDGSVYALNAGAGSSVEISEDCYSVLSTTMRYHALTGGLLDPGLYPIILAWGFTTGDYRVPEQSELDTLLAAKDTEGIVLSEDSCAATIPAGMEISLGAVAKGYAAQRVTQIMEEAGVAHAIVSFGGDVVTLGETKPDGSAWQVAVTDPNDTGSYVGVISVGQTSVLTSGSYERYFEQDGVTYIHIIDPATGYPVQNDLLSVTVVTEDAAAADALSTSLFVLGSEGALAFWREHPEEDLELVLITTDDEVIVTSGLQDIFTESSKDYTYVYIE